MTSSLRKAYPQLPDVTDDPGSLKAWVIVATQIIRTLTGQRDGAGHANTINVTRQDEPTQVIPDGLRNGDLWIVLPARVAQPLARYVWHDNEWVPLNSLW